MTVFENHSTDEILELSPIGKRMAINELKTENLRMKIREEKIMIAVQEIVTAFKMQDLLKVGQFLHSLNRFLQNV